MNWFRIQYNKLVELLLPPRLRQQYTIIVLCAMIAPVVWLYDLFMRYRNANLYHLSITGQVFSLERMLNDRYDSVQRRIYIDNGEFFMPEYIFMEDEDEDIYLYTEDEGEDTYIYTAAETGSEAVDFIVYVPSSVIYDESEMSALIDIYKLPSKQYKITTI